MLRPRGGHGSRPRRGSGSLYVGMMVKRVRAAMCEIMLGGSFVNALLGAHNTSINVLKHSRRLYITQFDPLCPLICCVELVDSFLRRGICVMSIELGNPRIVAYSRGVSEKYKLLEVDEKFVKEILENG